MGHKILIYFFGAISAILHDSTPIQLKLLEIRYALIFYVVYHSLRGNIMDLLMAGSTSVATSILYILLHCADNPGTVQAKIQKEVDSVVGCGRTPTWEDHRLMPYSMAVIWEMSRWKPILTLSLPREVDEDVFLNGYLIPKGTIVVANVWAAHFDPKHWKNPEEFNPSRFLTPNESALLPRPECLIPFSIVKSRVYLKGDKLRRAIERDEGCCVWVHDSGCGTRFFVLLFFLNSKFCFANQVARFK
ncbi:hypothetical protein HPB47_009432 [Ixodes persulcatus]|uniref:Uncharacterized protein n=1 Tax=Ixodes persulcatus TaxID=34615 RepID=A0AC60P272_IXOPE|nr:hypothetical protein HPB47_009432 [Ixodes persulcatus]